MKPSVAILGCALVLTAGCSRSPDVEASATGQVPAPPFLGVPEDRTRKIEEENPGIDSRLRGLTTMTEVQTADHATYLRVKKEGRIAKEETRGGIVYFSVDELRNVPLANGGAGAASGAAVTVVSRYKAAIPNGA
jgi:hypothetical protein